MPRAKKDQQKVHILKRTTGLCPFRSYLLYGFTFGHGEGSDPAEAGVLVLSDERGAGIPESYAANKISHHTVHTHSKMQSWAHGNFVASRQRESILEIQGQKTF